MAVDSWMPHRFSQLSDRLVTKNGIYLMGLAGDRRAALHARQHPDAGGHVLDQRLHHLFTDRARDGAPLDQGPGERAEVEEPARHSRHRSGDVCQHSGHHVFEKFAQGGWITVVVITGSSSPSASGIHRHYEESSAGLRRLDDILTTVPLPEQSRKSAASGLDPNVPTAVISVSSFSGFGLHQILSIHKAFPNYFKQFIFVSAAVVDSGNFKGAEELERLEQTTEGHLRKYVAWAQAHGFKADYRMAVGTEAVATVEAICRRRREGVSARDLLHGTPDLPAKRSGTTGCSITRHRTPFSAGCSSRAFRRWCCRFGC